jgi:hypothetical protein
MKLRMAVLSASVVWLAACASSGGTTSYAPEAKSYPQTRLDNDELYMARVEAAARRRGIDLTWVNPPRKIVAKQE